MKNIDTYMLLQGMLAEPDGEEQESVSKQASAQEGSQRHLFVQKDIWIMCQRNEFASNP